ncbi:Sephs1 [Symbiodinium sp. CCMP2592]|nr:Sephs1 [Symbiodinium sp. CCMP2592]
MLKEDSPDVSLVPIGAAGECIYLASTTDCFSPISLDRYNQGRIACANTLSDLYAIGAHRIDTILICKHSLGCTCNWSPSRRHYSYDLLTRMEDRYRDVVIRRMIQGFNDACKEAGTRVTGGQALFHPWPIIGGCATTTLTGKDLVRVDGLQLDDACSDQTPRLSDRSKSCTLAGRSEQTAEGQCPD